ncbi:transglutaminase family protein [Jiangella alkaliphila]|uniref:Transglutaminase-like enzyme, putative cysteine protease n=1 Tax=Jiangella alkaliphila TaxID=419479 RepID=A0A1H2L565_9ACTN|nr:DUF3488 and transglutaminase-like domain-containing protein [Jiangella alkaliphila]SDU75942.1 Transglutaminase-like enzyme, putative cysteine protease [Jiangella alkaliphila]
MSSLSAHGRLTIVAAVAAWLSVLPLFSITQTDDWIVPAAIVVALVAGSGYVLRKLGVPSLLVPVAQLAVVVLWLGVLVANDVALLGFIPTTDWATRLVDVFQEGTDVTSTYVAPIPVPRGILMMLVGGAGLVALLVDALAVWLRKVPLAGVPLAACYTVAASVMSTGLDWWWFLPPATGFLALLVSEGRTRVAAWGRSASPSARRSGIPETDSLARNGRRVGAVALAVAVAVPGIAPVLTEGVLGPGQGRGGGGGQTIRTDNPIIDLQRNLQRQENVEVLQYSSATEAPTYIRIVTLDVFDGEEWKTSDRPVPDSVDSGMPHPQGLADADWPYVDYEISVTPDFSSSWLPLPYPAQSIDIEGDWRYHAPTLDVVADGDDVRARTYDVRSLVVEPTVDALRNAGPPSDDVDAMLELPDELPSMVTDLAEQVTEGAEDDFSRAAALQQWFRVEGDFEYDIEATSGHTTNALVEFLNDRVGYCEQFAATMAIMARYLGIPARVAVGFTQGRPAPGGDGTYIVQSHDSHAWPELYFEGSGWVRFEPTPGEITGVAPDWTTVPSQNAPVPDPNDPSAPAPSPSSTVPSIPRDDQLGGGAASGSQDPPSQWPLILLGVLALVAFFATPSVAARIGRELRWRRAGDDAGALAEAAWADLREAARDAGQPWDPAATPRVTGRRLATSASLDDDERQLLDHLVGAVEQARYARRAEPVEALREDTDMVRRSIGRSASLGQRIQAFLLPTRLRDSAGEANRRLVDGFDWIDTTGERLRTSIGSVSLRRQAAAPAPRPPAE